MDDQISRQAAIKIIKNYCENGCDIAEDNWCPSCQREQFIKLLEALPSAQPEIIRCKDCKHHHRDNSGAYYCGIKDYGYGWGLNDFCSDAERREE